MLLDATKAFLLVIDIQERLLHVMQEPERVVSKTQILMKAAATLGLPQVISEQYPKGLGRTVAALQSNGAATFEKMSFSCWRDAALKSHLIQHHEAGRPQAIVAGIEAHVCVLQTCVDLAMAGFAVFAVADAMSSRKGESASLAIERMRMSGVQVVNTEMVLFELLEKAGTAAFKGLSGLIR
jgi:nicotinamidase-related amidase